MGVNSINKFSRFKSLILFDKIMKNLSKENKEEELINILEIDNDQKHLKLTFLGREIR